jgi:hypothetical protein
MADEQILANAQLAFPNEMAIFSKAVQNVGVKDSVFVEFKPVSTQYSSESPVEFLIPPSASSYMDLSQTYLKVKCKITLKDGSPLPSVHGETIPDIARVGPCNNLFNGMWDQVDLWLNSTLMTSSQTGYAYSSYLLNVLMTPASLKDTVMRKYVSTKSSFRSA